MSSVSYLQTNISNFTESLLNITKLHQHSTTNILISQLWKKIKLLLSRVLNINLLINPKKKKRERNKENPSTTEARGIIHFRTKSFLKLGEHPSRSPGLPALTRKLIKCRGPHTHPPLPPSFFSPRQPAEIGVEKGQRSFPGPNRVPIVEGSLLLPLPSLASLHR